MPAWWAIMFAAIGSGLVFALLGVWAWRTLLWEQQGIENAEAPDRKTELKRISVFTLFGIFGVLGIPILIGIPLGFVIRVFDHLIWSTAPNGGWVARPVFPEWHGLAMAIAFSFVVLPISLLGRRLFRGYHALHIGSAGSKAAATRSVQMLRWGMPLLQLGLFAALVLEWNFAVRVDEDKVQISRWYSLNTKSYSPDDIRAVFLVAGGTAPNGQASTRSRIVIEFVDDTHYTAFDTYDWDPQEMDSALKEFASRHQIPVQPVAIYSPLPTP